MMKVERDKIRGGSGNRVKDDDQRTEGREGE